MYVLLFEYWGSSVHVFQGRARRALFSLRGIRVKTCQEIQSSLLEKKLCSLTKSKLGLSSLLVSKDEVEGFSLPFEGRRGNQTSLVKA